MRSARLTRVGSSVDGGNDEIESSEAVGTRGGSFRGLCGVGPTGEAGSVYCTALVGRCPAPASGEQPHL
jgi:hypothetical protein